MYVIMWALMYTMDISGLALHEVGEWKANSYDHAITLLSQCNELAQASETVLECILITGEE